MPLLRVTHGENDLLFTTDGQSYIDLIGNTGAVFLGHTNVAVNRHVVEQLDRISSSWTSVMAIQDECKALVGRHLDSNLSLYSLYSSGMEAAEVAMRIAMHETKRSGIIGFQNNHHGKSVATQNISGPDADLPLLAGFDRIPFLPGCSEAESLGHLEATITSGTHAAVFVEPMQGKGGGHSASEAFYSELQRLSAENGVLIICDEIFSGFYRTGSCFRYTALGIEPDIVLIGKAVSNGFPAAGVVLSERLGYHPKDFRFTSTFSDNPLACAAVIGTTTEMERIEIEKQVARIERSLAELDASPRGDLRLRGAACFLELDSEDAATRVHDHLFRHNVLAVQRGAVLGFWPAATITDEHLERVVDVANEALATLR